MQVIGTPAEEAAGGKVYMVARGAFDGLDCAMMVHPGNRDTAVAYALACLELDVEFHGQAPRTPRRARRRASTPSTPWSRRSSTSACLRQQVRDSARIHGIITDGGQAVNVIPHHTAAKLLVRTEEDDYMDDVLKPKVLACFEGAAKATGCELKYKWGEESRYKTMRTNMALADAYRANVESLGRHDGDPGVQALHGLDRHGQRQPGRPGHPPGHRHRAVGRADPHRRSSASSPRARPATRACWTPRRRWR